MLIWLMSSFRAWAIRGMSGRSRVTVRCRGADLATAKAALKVIPAKRALGGGEHAANLDADSATVLAFPVPRRSPASLHARPARPLLSPPLAREDRVVRRLQPARPVKHADDLGLATALENLPQAIDRPEPEPESGGDLLRTARGRVQPAQRSQDRETLRLPRRVPAVCLCSAAQNRADSGSGNLR